MGGGGEVFGTGGRGKAGGVAAGAAERPRNGLVAHAEAFCELHGDGGACQQGCGLGGELFRLWVGGFLAGGGVLHHTAGGADEERSTGGGLGLVHADI